VTVTVTVTVRSREWDSVPEKVKQDIGMQVKREGEFWSVVASTFSICSFRVAW